MITIEHTEQKLVLVDDHKDKKLGLTLAGIFFGVVAFIFAKEGAWEISIFLALIGVGLALYPRLTTQATNTITFDKSTDIVQLVASDNSELGFQELLSDIERVEVSQKYPRRSAGESPLECPMLVFKNGKVCMLRAYHSAGSQSRDTVDLIQEFLK